LGVSSVQAGALEIPTTLPETLDLLDGHGDTIFVGSFVFMYTKTRGVREEDSTIYRIFRIHRSYDGEIGILFAPAGETNESRLQRRRSLWCASVGNETFDWKRFFRLATQDEIDAWFNARFALPDGWRPLHDYKSKEPPDLRFEGGVPVEIRRDGGRRPDNMSALIVEAGDRYGFDFTVGRYTDKEKTLAPVRNAKRRSPPKIGE
jgi:hypothetical protein